MSLLLPILPSNLDPNYCFTGWQKTLNDFANAMKAVLNGETFFNQGDQVPPPELQAYPWFRSTDGRWYIYSGSWLSPNPETSTDVLRIFTGTKASIWSYDGGDGSDPATVTPGPSVGAMWDVATELTDNLPIGVGTTVATVLGTGGSATAVLSMANMDHWHGVGTDGAPGGNDPPIMISRPWGVSPTTFTERLQDSPGAGTWGDGPLFSSGTMGSTGPIANSTLPTAFSIIPPVVGVYFIKRTGRQFYKV